MSAPCWGLGRPARDLAIDLGQSGDADDRPDRTTAIGPGEWLEHSPLLTVLVVALGAAYLIRYFMQAGEPLNAINLNI